MEHVVPSVSHPPPPPIPPPSSYKDQITAHKTGNLQKPNSPIYWETFPTFHQQAEKMF